ncbi:MAG: CHRD domain-containing protein [Burkholderiales bacterium]
MSRILTIVAAVVGLFVVSTAQADIILFANITNSLENPPTNPTTSAGLPRPSFGTAVFDLNNAQTSMTFTATIFNIDFTGSQSPSDPNDNLVAAHIHASPTAAPNAPNAPVVWGFFGAPFNDNNPNDVVITPFVTGIGGTISGKWDAPEGNGTTLAAQLPNILSGHSYINFHTTQFPGGETRGFLVVLPEPPSLALLGIGALGLFAFGLRRRASPRF